MTYRMCKGKYVILKRCVQITWRAAHRLPVRLRSQSARDREASRNGIPRRQPPLVLPGAQHESRPGSAPFDRHRSRCHAGGVNELPLWRWRCCRMKNPSGRHWSGAPRVRPITTWNTKTVPERGRTCFQIGYRNLLEHGIEDAENHQRTMCSR